MKFNFTKYNEPIDQPVGLYCDIPDEVYRRWNCFSKSLVAPALRSAEHLRKYIDEPPVKKSFIMGNLVDCLILEPQCFTDRYMIQPETYTSVTITKPKTSRIEVVTEKSWNANSNTCKKIIKTAADDGKTLISSSDLDFATQCRDALLENNDFAAVYNRGKKQVSVVWVDEQTGVKCKGRIDLLDGNHIWDLKTTRDASTDGFGFDLGKYNYHVQAGAYCSALEAIDGTCTGFNFACVETGRETTRPSVALYAIDDESIQAGLLKFRRACRKIAGYSDKNLTGYSRFIEPISIKTWEINREFDLAEEHLSEGEF